MVLNVCEMKIGKRSIKSSTYDLYVSLGWLSGVQLSVRYQQFKAMEEGDQEGSEAGALANQQRTLRGFGGRNITAEIKTAQAMPHIIHYQLAFWVQSPLVKAILLQGWLILPFNVKCFCGLRNAP